MAKLTATRRGWMSGFLSVQVAIVGLSLTMASGCGSFAAQGRNAEGVRLFQQARYQEAIQQFHQAINAEPNNADCYYNMAAVYHRLGTLNSTPADLKQAEHYYLMCRDRNPDHTECYRGMAVLMTQQGRGEAAFKLLEDWAARQPTLPDPKIELARLHQEYGQPRTAKEHLLEALAVDHDNSRALTAMGSIREQLGESAQAMEDYQRSLAMNRFQPEVAARVATLQSGLGTTPTILSPSMTTSGGTRIVTGGAPVLR
ncbi:MAG: tetratricopeptide repeat protein [Thermoguttaceae bacterium]